MSSKFLVVLTVVLLLFPSCDEKKSDKTLKKFAINTLVCGIGQNENIATVESYTTFSFIKDGIRYETVNGETHFKVEPKNISADDNLQNIMAADTKKLVNGMTMYHYQYSGDVFLPIMDYKKIISKAIITNKQAEFLPKLIVNALNEYYKNNPGNHKGIIYLQSLDFHEEADKVVSFVAELLIAQ